VYTPQLTTALNGITWRSVQSICTDLGIGVEKTRLTRDDIYIADEAFFTGTAAEVTPVTQIGDHKFPVGTITRQLMEDFEKLVRVPEKASAA